MIDFLTAYAAVLDVLRVVFFALAAVAAIVCLLDWLARTRRISPFNPVARTLRRSVDPLLLPVERRVVRAGGLPASAPWWALVGVVVGGILVLVTLQFIGQQLARLADTAGAGPGSMVRLLITWIFGVLKIALIIRVVVSWLRLSPYRPWIRWTFTLTEPLLRPLRQVVPPLGGMIDITPIIAYFILWILEGLVLSIV